MSNCEPAAGCWQHAALLLIQLIQKVQCHAVRDVQIQEKNQNHTEWLDEEKRLDAMMEVERRQALEAQEQIEQLRKQQRIQ